MYSGSPDAHAGARETLLAIGSEPIHLDAEPGAANSYDTALLDIFHTTVHAIVHGFALVTAEGISGREFRRFRCWSIDDADWMWAAITDTAIAWDG